MTMTRDEVVARARKEIQRREDENWLPSAAILRALLALVEGDGAGFEVIADEATSKFIKERIARARLEVEV